MNKLFIHFKDDIKYLNNQYHMFKHIYSTKDGIYDNVIEYIDRLIYFFTEEYILDVDFQKEYLPYLLLIKMVYTDKGYIYRMSTSKIVEYTMDLLTDLFNGNKTGVKVSKIGKIINKDLEKYEWFDMDESFEKVFFVEHFE